MKEASGAVTLIGIIALLGATGCSARPNGPALSSAVRPKVIYGYYPASAKDEHPWTLLKLDSLTHLAHAFTKPDSFGGLVVPPGFLYPELVNGAHARGVRVLMSVGGWENCEGFPGMASRPETRQRFISEALAFCRTNGYDGVDLDWEFVSNAEERVNFTLLVKELSRALRSQSPPLLLTAAVPSGPYWGRWIAYEDVVPDFDFISFMTYDYHGAWSDHAGHNAPLFSCGDADGSMSDTWDYAKSRGIPDNKLLLGVPFFGRSFDSPAFYGPATKSDYVPYKQAMELRSQGWFSMWDDCASVAYLRSPDRGTVVSYDNRHSVALKCRFVKAKRAAGLIIWELTLDYRDGRPELLDVIAGEFRSR